MAQTLASLQRGALELRLRRTIAQAMSDGDFGKELEARRLLSDLMNPVDYQAQLAEQTGPLEAAAVAAGGEAERLMSGGKRLLGRAIGDEQMVAETRAADAQRQAVLDPLKEAHPVATTVGEMLPGMAVPGGAAGGLARRALTAGAAGLGYEALGQGGDIGLGDAAAIAALSGAGSLAGDVLGRGLAGHPATRVTGRMSPEHADMVRRARALGYGLTPGQRLDATNLLKIEAGWARNPYIGRAFDALQEGRQDLANEIGRRAIGLDRAGKITDDVLEASHKRIGRAMRDAAGDTPFELGDDFVDALADIELRHATVFADTDGQRIRTMINKALDRTAKGKPLSIDEYLLQTSELARLSRKSAESPDVARAAHELRRALDDAFDASAVGSLPDLQAAKGQYRALRELEAPGVLKGGNLSLPTLHNKLERLQRGRVGGLRELDEAARVGHYFADTVPNSGTPTGMAGQMMLEGNPWTWTRARIGELMGDAYLSPLGSGMATQPGLLGLPMSALDVAPAWARGLLNATPEAAQRAGRQYGLEEAQNPPGWGLPLF